MGKFHSKHGDCYIDVNTHTNPMLSSDSDCSHQPLITEDSDVTCKDFTEIHVPLQVVLPPLVKESIVKDLKLHAMDKKDAHTDTDTTDNNVSMTQGHTLQLEEFECGVSVQSSRSDKQEWSFTLYDFDGQGRVTKEDLGQLLKSLYDAVGSTISLPPEGTKSLKLKLTVSPDQTKVHASSDSALPPPDLNRKECNRDKEQKHSPKKDINTKLNNTSVPVSPAKRNNAEAVSSPTRVELRNNLSKVHRGSHSQSSPSKRMSAAEHRQLVDLVQYNMMQQDHPNPSHKHHKVRRHHSELTGTQTGVHHTPKRSNRMSVHASTSQENPDRRNYYLDLAGIENPASTSFLNSSLPEPIPEGAAVSSPHRTHDKSRSKSRAEKHARKSAVKEQKDSRNKEEEKGERVIEVNRDIGVFVDVAPAPVLTSTPRKSTDPHRTGKSTHASGSPQKTPKASKHSRQVHAAEFATAVSPLITAAQTAAEVTSTALPLPRKHKTRGKNHVRAMQQVADWIEKEHSLKCDADHLILQRHEHHHIHEHHHHHHYHHYHES